MGMDEKQITENNAELSERKSMTPEQHKDLKRRLARVEGQVRGISRMLDESRHCKDVITQISAVSRALEQIGFRLVASQITYCLEFPDQAIADGRSIDEIEKLFLKLK